MTIAKHTKFIASAAELLDELYNSKSRYRPESWLGQADAYLKMIDEQMPDKWPSICQDEIAEFNRLLRLCQNHALAPDTPTEASFDAERLQVELGKLLYCAIAVVEKLTKYKQGNRKTRRKKTLKSNYNGTKSRKNS